MNTKSAMYLIRSAFAATALLAAGIAAAADVSVSLTAQRMTATMPDGATVPMWGYCTTASTTAAGTCPALGNGAWTPGPTLVVPYDVVGSNSLTITLTNALPVPTSIVILGQVGGGLGTPVKMASPTHITQNQTTWPGNVGPPDTTAFVPPAQLDRVKSFGTEVANGTTSASPLVWTGLKPGTYIYETGTLPSIQAPMGLYGVLIVTQAPVAADPVAVTAFAAGNAYPNNPTPIAYDSDVSLLFSEVDAVQNRAVDAAAVALADINKRFDDVSCSTATPCYPAAVNYTPTYFLINGHAYDATTPLNSAFAVAGNSVAPGAASVGGKILVRLLNAGLRTHVPSIVGMPVTIVAEDGNVAPGNAKVQNEVLLTAGKTHDVLITAPSAIGAYSASTFSVFDRQLSLTSGNAPDGGMQGFLQVAGGTLPTAVGPTLVNDAFKVPYNTPISGNVKLNDIGVAAVLPGTSPTHGSLVLNSDGTFVYTPTTNYSGADSFTYGASNTGAQSAKVSLTTASVAAGTLTAVRDTYDSTLLSRFSASRPGVLANDTDSNGYSLSATSAVNGSGGSACGSVVLNTDGSFTATKGSGNSCSFTYVAKNVQGSTSSPAIVTVNFLKAGLQAGLKVRVFDPASNADISDYRWIIQEDLTFKVDPTGTPSISTRTLGTSFHKSYMPIVATGCVGPVSCGSGNQSRTDNTTVDPTTGTLGARHILTDAEALALQAMPDQAVLDPTKHYYISILPGDAAGDAAGNSGHGMGGTEIKPGDVTASATTPISIAANAYDWTPAQLSIYIYEDNAPLNGQNDQDEPGLGGFNIILMDAVGRSGDVAGQQTYDAGGMPLSNALLGRPGCPDDLNINTNGRSHTDGTVDNSASGKFVGLVYTCPNAPDRGPAPRRNQFSSNALFLAALNAYNNLLAQDAVDYVLAGHALIRNVTPARYDVIAHPAADRQGKGEVWWQVETLEGTPAQDAFTGVKEPVYFQEFGPPGFHTTIGFVNPDSVKKYATDQQLTGTNTITGHVTNQHMSRPSNVTLWDAGTYDLLSSTTCQVALNSQGGDGPTIAIAQCDHDGNFTLSNVPAGSYEISVWDQWLDQIIQAVAVSVPEGGSKLVAMGNLPVLSWFTQYDQNIFQESPTKAASLRGIYSPDSGDKGISNVTMTTRYRDGGISNQTATDSNGNGLLAELFPLFNWYVTEADTTRFKQTGVNIIVDAGGKPDTAGDGAGLWNSTYQATPLNPANCTPSGYPGPTDPGYVNLGPPCAAANTTSRVEIPGAYSYGLQGFISQRNTINWARMPYAAGENGGIQGTVVYSTTRPFDDQRYNVQTLWEPLVPRVTVNLYRKQKLADGTETLTLVDHTQTSSFDDFVNAVDANGKQTNMQCPGQRTDDPFFQYTLGGTDQFRCYDGWHNWNQVQAAPYDGRYAFPTANCAACQNNPNAGQPGSPAKILPPGDYVVEAVTPPGFEVVKEEDKNILNGDSFDAPVYTQFAGIGNVFILPDQATLNNANPYNLKTADGVANNATSDLGVSSSLVNQPDCVGNLHRVPDFLSLFPQGGLVAPFSGMDRPLCDRKLVKLGDQMQASATFFVFTQVPAAAAGTGIILDDATSEFNAAAPDFGEKASVPFVPVSIKDFNGREIGRSYSDQWGAYNVLTPSSWLVNPPTPSGYGPNMLVTCMNDPGPIKDPVTGLMITDPQYNPAYSNFCYTLPFMPGRTTYLDTPVLPIAAFAAGYTPADCAYPDLTPTIARVDHAATAAGFGPYVASGSGPNSSLTITSQGIQNVPNPAYAGPFATVGPPSQRTLVRNYGFGDAKGTVKIGGTTIPSANVTWANGAITIVGTTANPIVSGELVVTTAGASPKSTIDAVTVTVGGSAPVRVQGSAGQTIQAAIDAAKPGDLILVDAGTYSELVVMWKPVRLQGVGANSVIINAAKYPTSKLDVWRPTINGLFGVDVTTGNLSTNGTQVDPLPGQEVTGGVVLLEPSVLGTEQGAGITVLAKGYRPDGVTPLTASNTDCSVTAPYTIALDRDNGANTVPTPHLSNFLCAASRIDGLSVTGGDAGGGIYVNGWAHNLEISNNRVYGNAGALNGGVRIGVPYLEQADFPLNAAGTAPNLVGPASNRFIEGFGYDNNVKIHHNAITKNGTVEGPAAGGGAGGGVSICSGTDGYLVDHNWVCGNFSSSDGGGVGHIGYSQSLVVGNQVVPNTISNNTILFNQSFQQSGSTHGGGIVVIGEPSIAGTLSLGTGNLTIDSNIVRGNFSEGGHGGGIRLQQVNGSDVAAFATDATRWHKVTVTNNTIDNNVAGWGGGGISLADTLNSAILNNTISSNDSTGIAGVLLTGGLPVQIPAAGVTGTTGKSHPNPAGISSDPTSTDLRNAGTNIPVISAPTLTNNIVWHNRSFYYDGTSGTATLCANNGTNTTCGLLADQATTGQCDLTNAKYWDLGILGAASVTDVSNVHPDAYAIASATQSTFGNNNPVRTVTAVLAIDSLLGNNQQVTIAGILPGTSGLIQAQINAVYHGVFAITLIDADTFSYTAKAFPAAVNISSIRKTAGLVTVTTSAPHGLVTGNQARIVVTPGNGTNNTNYGGTFIVTVLTPTTFTYTKGTNTSGPLSNNGTARLTLTDAQFGLLDFSAATATPLAIVVQPVNNLSPTYSVLSSLTGYATATNTAVDPNLKDLYCNGARVTPEFSANNPPGSVNNLQVAATTDEGNNYVNLRYGPLYLAKPASATGAPYTAFGDYHLTASSAAAINAGTPIAGVTHDIDGDQRGPGATGPNGQYDRGSDEYAATVVSTDLSITKTDNVTTVNAGGTVNYIITVSNAGASTVTGATVSDTFPAVLAGVTWTCGSVPAGASCVVGGSGNSRTGTVTLPAGGSVTFNATGSVPASSSGAMSNTATVAAPSGVIDSNLVNNTATDIDTIIPPRPTFATFLDNFNRTTGLGTNWQQLAGAVGINANEATCTGALACALAPGTAYWNAGTFAVKQAATLLITNNPPTNGAAPVNGASLILEAGSGTLPQSFVRVRYAGGQVEVASTNTFGVSYAVAPGGSFAGTFVTGDTMTALVDASGMVYVWRTTSASVTTLLGSVQLPTTGANSFTVSGGRIGVQVPTNARVDNFAGGTVP